MVEVWMLRSVELRKSGSKQWQYFSPRRIRVSKGVGKERGLTVLSVEKKHRILTDR